jgi:hypothetical protein
MMAAMAVLPVGKTVYTVRIELDSKIVEIRSSDNLCLARKGKHS